MPSDTPTFPVLSQDIMNTLRDDIGEETFNEALDAFLEEMSDSIDAIQRITDMSQLVTHAHSLKSSARMFGAMALAETAFELEQSARQNNAQDSQQILPRLITKCQETRRILEQISQGCQTC